ncbi:DUF421 domain-containing protein [Cytobacillus solani]|uniref:DUF421 domain-containing protein n=1 Tax=Cytobacillus solani TaxID=1637975 RepID=A0A0Q3VHZ7_9BACI|nr:DUF421 domain-containing protein [Cytobacillus solani]KOP82930.1 hypothetical protein AMS60_10895 [Bacillus sp. FJAT-21945]KQL19954.1 hypothetical protein AN957_16200 [Cytobacillus solani]USK53197.1 DUF421 domain-containing protein [Cytobacillus solani]
MSDWSHIIVRSILFMIVLFFFTKILGKKQISEISFFEYISGITIGSIAGEVIMGLESNMAHGILAIFLFGSITYLVDFLSLKSNSFRDFVEGKSTIFIKDGKIMEDNLKKEKYSTDELGSLLRQKNVFNVADVEFAVLEPTGDLSVLLKRENRSLTAKDLNIKVPNEKAPQMIIRDGEIVYDALAAVGKSRKWLDLELEKLNVTLDNVFYGQVDSYGELTVDLFDDKIQVPTPQTRPLLMAMMKKCQADLEIFSLETESEDAKKMYEKNAKKLNEAIKILGPYLSN